MARQKKQETQESILAAIRRVAVRLGRAPTRAEFTRMAGISHFRVLAHFPSLRAAVREAGLEPHPQGLRIPSVELLRDWAAVARRLGAAPSRSQYLRHGRYSAGVFTLRFGSWTGMAERFRRSAREYGLEEEWADVMRMAENAGDRREAMTDLGRGDAAYLPPPSLRGAEAGGPQLCLPPPLVERRCVTQSILAMIVNTLAPEQAAHSSLHKLAPIADSSGRFYRDRPVLGAPLGLPGLAFEPVNETGVVFLFGMMAHRLGFRVEFLQPGFPDCEAVRQIRPGRWQRVRIEFEYESRNFQSHRHPAEACDLIVCWRHNWAECPEGLEVLELWRAVV